MFFLAVPAAAAMKTGAIALAKFLAATAGAALTAYAVDYARTAAKKADPNDVYRTEYEKAKAKIDAERDASMA